MMKRLTACVLLLLMACSASCRAPSRKTILFPSAIITAGHVDEAVAFEAELARRYDTPAPAGTPWFEVLPGESNVLIVAGHTTAHVREGVPTVADAGTGSLAVMLNELAGCPTIHTTYQSPSDPNCYDHSEFKSALAAMIEKHRPVIVLDLHGSNANRPYDMDFGTIGGTSLLRRGDLLKRLACCLKREGMLNLSQDFFAASREGTVTRFVSARGVPCVQLEFNSTWLVRPRGSSAETSLFRHRFGQALQGMVRFVQSVDAEPANRAINRSPTRACCGR